MQTQKIIPLTPAFTVPDTMPRLPTTWPKNAPSSFHVLGKPSGATCNLDCTYCFFLSKEKLYPNSRFRMSDETLETYIRQVIESQRAPEVTISWQGGEPTLMGLDFFKRAMDYVIHYAHPGVSVGHTMQNQRCAFFLRHVAMPWHLSITAISSPVTTLSSRNICWAILKTRI
jgi:hypothetical protein